MLVGMAEVGPTQLPLSWFCWFLTGRSKQTSANWLLSDFGQTLGLLPLPPPCCLRSRPVPVVCLSGLAAVCCGLAGVPGSGWPVCSCGLASLPRAFRPGHAQAMVRRLLDELNSIMDPVLYLHREASPNILGMRLCPCIGRVPPNFQFTRS